MVSYANALGYLSTRRYATLRPWAGILRPIIAANEQSERQPSHSFVCQPGESAYPHVDLALVGRRYHSGLHLFFWHPKHSLPMPDDHSLRFGGFFEPLADFGAG